MRFRNTLALLVVLLGLGSYVLFVERKKPSPQEAGATPTATVRPRLFDFNATDARAVSLQLGEGDKRTRLEYRDDGNWYLVDPLDDEADQSRVTRFVELVAALKPLRELAGANDFREYGLDPPSMQVTVKLADGTARELHVGDKSPSQTGYYGRVYGRDVIYLLPTSIGADVERYLNEPPVKPTAIPAPTGALPPVIPPPPTPMGSATE